MAESSVIREFLVALSFKSDERSLKDFEAGITKATKAVVALAAAVEGTAVTVAAGVARWASGLENLYFASIKANASATNLKAFDRAAQNMGTQAGEAAESVQALARYLRDNPGGESYLAQFGVQTRDLNGHLRDTTDLMTQLGTRWHALFPSSDQYYMANQYAQQFGISEDTLRAMLRPDFAQQMQSMQDKMRNSGFDKAASDAHQFGIQMRDLQTNLEAFGNHVYEALSKKLGFSLDRLNDWMQKNGPALADKVAADILKVIDLAEQLAKKIKSWTDEFMAFDQRTGGLAHKVLEIGIALKMFGGTEIIGGVLGLTAAFIRLGAALVAVQGASAAAGGAGLLARLGALGTGAAGLGAFGAMLGGLGTAGYAAYKAATGQDASNLASGYADKGVQKLSGGTSLSLGDWLYRHTHYGEETRQYFKSQGWSDAQIQGILANLQAESGGRPTKSGDNGAAYGLMQWHPDRQAMFKKLFGTDMRNADWTKQLEFVNWELNHTEKRAGDLLRASNNAQQAARIVSRYYERPAGGAPEADRRAASVVNLKADTTIHVNGSADSKATGREVAAQQKNVNSELVRNFYPNME